MVNDQVNFDLDDTARRIGHLVLRIWQLEEENKRLTAPKPELVPGYPNAPDLERSEVG